MDFYFIPENKTKFQLDRIFRLVENKFPIAPSVKWKTE